MTRILLIDLSALWWWRWMAGAGKPVDDAHAWCLGKVRQLSGVYASGSVGVGICVDRGRCFRKDIDHNYKAQRAEKDPVGVAQLERLVETLEEEGYPILGADGFEGDDVIASAVAWAKANEAASESARCEVVIAANDKDLLSLIEPGVSVYQLTKSDLWGPDHVLTKLKVNPTQVRDLLALCGDKADNVPGVKGLGPVHAARLLGQFGSVQNLVANLHVKDERGKEVVQTDAIRNAIIVHLADLELSRQLVTLRTDVPCNFSQLLDERKPRPAKMLPTTPVDLDEEDDTMGFDECEPEPEPESSRARPADQEAASERRDAARQSRGPLEIGEECDKCGANTVHAGDFAMEPGRKACRLCDWIEPWPRPDYSAPIPCATCGRPNCGADGQRCPGAPPKIAQSAIAPTGTAPQRAEPDQVWRDAEATRARISRTESRLEGMRDGSAAAPAATVANSGGAPNTTPGQGSNANAVSYPAPDPRPSEVGASPKGAAEGIPVRGGSGEVIGTSRTMGVVEADAGAKAEAARAAALAGKSPPPEVVERAPANGAPLAKKRDPAEEAAAYVEAKEGAALARLDPNDPAWRVALEPRSAGQAIRIAHVLFNARIFPHGTPEGVFAIMLLARERGLGIITALTNVHMIEGKPSMSAGLIGGLVLASGKADYFEIVSATHTEAKLVTKRRGGSGRESEWTFTMQDAERAGLLRPSKSGKPTQWERNPRAMLIARVTTLAARAVYGDICTGLYTPEELSDEREVDATPHVEARGS